MDEIKNILATSNLKTGTAIPLEAEVNLPPRVLVACEYSGIVRDAFATQGCDAWSCDLLPTEKPGQHFQCDVREVLTLGWDLMIAHPPCTYLANSGARWLFEKDGRWEQMREAGKFFNLLKNTNIEFIAIENPQPHKWATEIIGKYNQKVQPYHFGEKQKKGICLWLKNLPVLLHTTPGLKPPEDKEELKKWERVWRMPPGKNQAKERSRFYVGVAKAMAEQWTPLLMRRSN